MTGFFGLSNILLTFTFDIFVLTGVEPFDFAVIFLGTTVLLLLVFVLSENILSTFNFDILVLTGVVPLTGDFISGFNPPPPIFGYPPAAYFFALFSADFDCIS